MELKIATIDAKIVNLINYYRRLPASEIKSIKPKWAIGEDSKELLNSTLLRSEGCSLLQVEAGRLIKSANFGEMGHFKLNPFKLFTGNPHSDFRIAKILDRWNNDGFIDPPEIFLNSFREITFSDGRHRSIVAFHIGVKEIPVMVHFAAEKAISNLLK